MSSLIADEIDKLQTEVPYLRRISNEYLFTIICYKYFYNKGLFSKADYSDCFVDGRSDGGVDLVSITENNNDQPSLLLIQGKSATSLQNAQDVVDVFNKMAQTNKDFQDNITSKYNQRLKRILKDKLSRLDGQTSTTEFICFLGAELSKSLRDKIRNIIDRNESFSDYQVNFFDSIQIEEKIQSVLAPQRYVAEAKIKFSKKDGHLKYKDNGLIVNLSANSLKDIYDQYKDCGLFEQNFRYYIRNKKIDDKINESLDKKRDEFWFLNNGIIIGCKDFRLDGDNIKLYNMSVINGCQTTTLIGDYKGKREGRDFLLPCKIVKPCEDTTDDEYSDFITDIAEASNSQKPISERDLKSNKPEQRKLQIALKEKEPKIYLEIKRGERMPRKVDEWHRISNEFFGQLVLSFNLQRPGTARSNKKVIFADTQVYSKIFHRQIDKENIIDVLSLYSKYHDYLNKQEFTEPEQESVSSNGKLIIMAVIGFFIKVKRGLVDLTKIRNDNKDVWINHLQTDNIQGKIFSDYSGDDLNDLLESLFTEIISQIATLYQTREKEEKTVSNFFKKDDSYTNIILSYLITNLFNKPVKKKELDVYLQIFK